MSDASLDATPADRPRLVYPFSELPTRAQRLQVAPGVHWIRMPLPFALDHINLWTLDDDSGYAIVDTGTRTDDGAAVWHDIFAALPEGQAPTRVFVTHMHPDHVGMAGWITRKFGVRLWMTRLEYLSCRVMAADTGREAPPDAIQFYRHAGWSDEAIETYRARFGNFGKLIHPLPESYRRLADGDELTIGGRRWQVVVGNGHSPEHACLFCPEQKLLISGDQVLPRISSNVSVNPIEPDADPMGDWLASLAKLRQLVSDDVLVLPSHNEPFRGLHTRLDALASGQERALQRLLRRLSEPRRAIDVFGALFARQIGDADVGLLGMATGESIACLNHLLQRGEASAELDDAGVRWYRAAAG
ncbi:MAG: MBL fold metallo-hydrolase [Rubrivivax sp.]|jgi:glyoxylase-like metal-dependent hydrolase (beta-lactamase superfamily II)|nr:MBL fold metallo-hydrolase [Rubrivivax sp.]MBK7260554.1 MBL fold metallo-hydrolase [Rubrivivax sp.]